MKKKIMMNLLLAILAVSIAGCGKGNIESRQESVPMEETAEESVSEEKNGPTGIITLSGKEQKDIGMLVGMLSLNSYFFGGDAYGSCYPTDDISVNMKLIDMIGNMGLTDKSYTEYLPPTETDESTLIRYCRAEDVQSYLKNVFGIENADISAFCDGDRVVFDMVGDFALEDTYIDEAVAMPDGTYKISGTFFLWMTEDILETAYPYELTAIKNDGSPFGFQMISMEFGEAVPGDYAWAEQVVEDGLLNDILLNPKENSKYYPQGVEYQHILFALLDIDQDGEDEVLLGSASDISPYWGANWITIFNILKYDRNTGEVSDFDGDKIYKPLDAYSWHYYDTGILMTMVEAGQGHTNFWNLRTGEFVDAALQVSEDPGSPDSEGHSKIYNVDGRDITGGEADQYYQSLKAGNEIPIVWCEVNQGNVDALVTGGTVMPVYIPTPYGRYTANRGFELEFFADHTVLISEGNANKKCVFTIDGAGNLIIDPDGEAVEGTYDSLADEIKIHELKFRR